MTARLWITMLGVALNTMHQRRARVLAREMSSGEPAVRGEPRSGGEPSGEMVREAERARGER